MGLQIFRVSIFHPDRKESVFLKSGEEFRVTSQFPPVEWSHVSLIVFPCSQYLKILYNLLLFLAPTTPVGTAIICNLRDILSPQLQSIYHSEKTRLLQHFLLRKPEWWLHTWDVKRHKTPMCMHTLQCTLYRLLISYYIYSSWSFLLKFYFLNFSHWKIEI